MRKSFFLFLVLFLVALTAGSDLVEDLTKDTYGDYETEWRALLYKVFTTTNKLLDHIEPHEVHEILSKLRQLYRGRTDAATLRRISKLDPLLNACEMKETDCSRQTFQDMSKLIAYNSPFSLNVVPYLRQCRRRQILTCQQNLHKNLVESLKKLSAEDKDNVRDLLKRLVEAEGSDRKSDRGAGYVPFDLLVKGAFGFLDHHDEVILREIAWEWNSKTALRRVDSLLESRILVMCLRIVKEVDQLKYIVEEGGSFKADDYVQEWMGASNVCALVINHAHSLSLRVYENILSKYEPPLEMKKKMRKKKKKKENPLARAKSTIKGCFVGKCQ